MNKCSKKRTKNPQLAQLEAFVIVTPNQLVAPGCADLRFAFLLACVSCVLWTQSGSKGGRRRYQSEINNYKLTDSVVNSRMWKNLKSGCML